MSGFFTAYKPEIWKARSGKWYNSRRKRTPYTITGFSDYWVVHHELSGVNSRYDTFVECVAHVTEACGKGLVLWCQQKGQAL
jgi:hypothetical protein